ncbi:MAG: molybdopterin-dependent oxidoreductase [Desulfobacteraceae bacterium]
MEKRNTMCRLCSAGRPIAAEVEEGRLVSAHTPPEAPGEYKYFCPKLKAAPDILYSPERLRFPLLKDSHRGNYYWKELTWEQALETAAERLQEVRRRYGAPALGWITGHVPDYGAPWDYANRFMSAYGSPNIFGNGSICHAAREMAHIFTYGAMTQPDYKHTRCMVVWGKNDADTNPAGHNMILAARKKGSKLIVIDPVRTKLASLADMWLQIKPGGDGLLAMAIIHVMIEEEIYDRGFVAQWTTGFDRLRQQAGDYSPENVAARIWLRPEEIRHAARLYAQTKPACMSDGNGLDMHLEVAQTMRAVCILRALSGNLDRKGGDLIPKPLPLRDIKLKERLPAEVKPVSSGYPLFSRYSKARADHCLGCVVDAVLLGEPYPLKALVVQGTNPAVTLANSRRAEAALEALEFMVVIDLFRTRTTRFADLILPATTPFETTQLNLKGMSSHRARLQNQVVEWYENARPDWKIIFDLAKAMGFEKDFPWQDVEEAIDYQLEPAGITVDMLRKAPGGLVYEEMRYEKHLEEGFSTPSGKVELISSRYEEHGYPPVPGFDLAEGDRMSFYQDKEDFPFIGISGARSRCYVHSQFRNIPSLLAREPEPFVDINPVDARALGIRDKELVRVESPNGWIRMKARIWDGIRAGSIRIPWGWGEWEKECGINNLTDDSEHDPVTSTTSNRCFRCRVLKEKSPQGVSLPSEKHY